jgi:hypothetical protein
LIPNWKYQNNRLAYLLTARRLRTIKLTPLQAHVWAALADKNGFWAASIELIEYHMTFAQKLEAAKKERALNAEPRER